jgi:hypothetical protein
VTQSDSPRKRAQGQRLTPAERTTTQARFLEHYARTANVGESCRVAGVSRQSVYRWLEDDEPFRLAYNQSRQESDDAIRSEIYRRAIEGVPEPVFHQGRRVGSVRKFSDVLLIFLAKSRMSEFRDKQTVEHSGPDGGPIQVREGRLESLTDDELRRLAG